MGISGGSASAGLNSSYGSIFITEANFTKVWGKPSGCHFRYYTENWQKYPVFLPNRLERGCGYCGVA